MRPLPDSPVIASRTYATGSSSVNANLADLRCLAGLLATTATSARSAAATSSGIEWNLPLRGDVLSPGTALTCAGDSLALAGSLTSSAMAAELYAGMLSATVVAYELAEAGANAAFLKVHVASTMALALSKVVVHLRTGAPLDPNLASDVTAAAVDLVSMVLPGATYEADMNLVAGLHAAIAGPTRPVTTHLVAGPGSPAAAPAATSLSTGMARTTALYEDGEKAAHIQVQRVVDPATGQGHWTVMLPGTSSWDYDAATPLDGGGNELAAAGLVSPAEAAVSKALADAMKREGVTGKNEPVLLVGHSQGGMVMTNLARHSKGVYNVTHILTYGSPVGASKVPPGVRSLNVENRADLVPNADGSRTGDGDPRRTRLVIEDPDSTRGADGSFDPIEAHSHQRYRTDFESAAKALHGAPDGPVTQFEAETRTFFQGKAATYGYEAKRLPEQCPAVETSPARAEGRPATHAGSTTDRSAVRPPALVNPSTGSYVVTSP